MERTSTTVQIGDNEIPITLDDLAEIRRAALLMAESHPDKDVLLSLLQNATPFISSDGLAHLGVFILMRTWTGEAAKLEYCPRPTTPVQDTFGFSIVLEHSARDGWSVREIGHVHYRWKA